MFFKTEHFLPGISQSAKLSNPAISVPTIAAILKKNATNNDIHISFRPVIILIASR